ncbi:hypothetical protein SAMN05216316_1765 [Nitrosovibrio sp. Nv6]|nr:hypothetical protein SAMN05216316_1765 [Nitrosovibrio sp. Nv6]
MADHQLALVLAAVLLNLTQIDKSWRKRQMR